jgi:hypothetical protein
MPRKLWILAATLSLLGAAPAGALKVYKTTSEGLADVKIYVTTARTRARFSQASKSASGHT